MIWRYRFALGGRTFYISARSEHAAKEAAEDITDYLLETA